MVASGKSQKPSTAKAESPEPKAVVIPQRGDATVRVDGRDVRLTNLHKVFWPELKITKGDLLQYYADVAPVLLPHIADRAMVMRRYPNGAFGESFFMKEAPSPRPPWIRICPIHHNDEKVVNFPVIDDLPSLLWVVNLGCIDLNQWYARCEDYNRPDYLHFDLDPSPGATFDQVLESALVVREALETLKMKPLVKTSGSRGCHVHVPIVHGPTQDDVLMFTKALATELSSRNPKLLTVEYRKSTRPKNRVLVDYRQNAWGQTLASIYSVRPTSTASVSTPLSWAEVEKGVAIEAFRLDNVRARIKKVGDLWKPLNAVKGRVNLGLFFGS
jgi:bifunctional non-homologous end joining protein LigD